MKTGKYHILQVVACGSAKMQNCLFKPQKNPLKIVVSP